MLTLYHAPTSVCSQKVRVGLAAMGQAYESRMLDLQAGDQFNPEYLALNPDAVVPTLVDGDIVVVESSLILAYLDREYNGSALMPSDRAGRAEAEHWLLRCIAIHAAINTVSFSTVMGPQIRAAKTDAEIDELAAKFPDPIMGAKRRDLVLNGLESPYVGQAFLHLRRMIGDMQAQLQAGPWLGGARMNISDIALVAYVDRLDRLGFAGLWDGADRIGPWLDAWKHTEAYKLGVAAHVPPGMDEKMRQNGSAKWPDLHRRWEAAV